MRRRVAAKCVDLDSSITSTELVSVDPNLCPSRCSPMCREAAHGAGVWGRSPQLAAAIAAASFFKLTVQRNRLPDEGEERRDGKEGREATGGDDGR